MSVISYILKGNVFFGYCKDKTTGLDYSPSATAGGANNNYASVLDPVTLVGAIGGGHINARYIDVTSRKVYGCASGTANALVYGLPLHSTNPRGTYGNYRPGTYAGSLSVAGAWTPLSAADGANWSTRVKNANP